MTEQLFSVMVVDDDEMFTSSMRRTLHRLKPNWQFTLLTEPLEAQRQLQHGQQPTVLLTDLLMPGMNGTELLEQAYQHSPLTLRALLTGYKDDNVLTQNNGIFHFILAKPFTDDDILHLLDSAEALEKLPLALETRINLGRLRDLPILPAIYNKLCTLLASPDNGLEDMAKLIEQDAYLSSRLLQIANSPFLGFSRATLSVLEAANRLGARLICSIVLALQTHQQLESLTSLAAHKSIAETTLMHALISRRLAAHAKLEQSERDEVYMVSLLSSLGELMIATDRNPNVLSHSTPEPYATDAIITAYLLTLWGFDEELCQMVLEQSSLDASKQMSDSAAIIAVARYAARGESPPQQLMQKSVNGVLLQTLLDQS